MKYFFIVLILWTALLNGLSIYEIQYTTDPGEGDYPSNYEGQTVTTGGIVTGTDYSNGRFFIGSSSGGAWSGLYIYNNDYDVATGDSVIVSGEVYEYHGFTEISPAYSVEIVSSGNPLPSPTPVSTWEAANQELFESVLVEVNEVEVTQEYDEWSEWDVNDGSGSCIISIGFMDLEEMGFPIISDYPFSSIQGIISYNWGEFQLNPRTLEDLYSADESYIISISDQYIYSSQEFTVPINLIFLGETQQAQNYQFSLEYNSEILSFSSYNTENTLSEGGSISVDQPIEGVVEVLFEDELSFSGLEILLNLSFTGISNGNADQQFSTFTIADTDVEYFSIGQIYIQTESTPIGDTLTVIQRPIINIPEIVIPGEEFTIQCVADEVTTDWFAELHYSNLILLLPLSESFYNSELDRWFLAATAPEPDIYELYDLVVGASNLETDTTENAVHLIPEEKAEYSFIQITDTHLPTHIFYPDPESLTDTTEVTDLREVIKDINLISPEFVLITGDFVNEGEMEDFENRRVYTKAQQMLAEFEVPVFLVAGNHDLGGWYNSPPSQGTARRDWWRFFGWKWLQDPPEEDPFYTQNYSFNYGPTHFIGMEAYLNYDDYMHNIYGDESFTSGQMQWLQNDLDNSSESETTILFYHYDFSEQIDLDGMGIDMALYGHIHSNDGNINIHPYNLATESTCDGERAYRVINVNGSTLDPQSTLNAGWSGDNLLIEYTPENDGTAESISALITNQHSLAFQDARIKFLMPSGEFEYTVENGELLQIDDSSDPVIVYVSTNIPAYGNITITITSEPVNSPDEQEVPDRDFEMHNFPNPFNPETVISFHFLENNVQENIELTIHNIKGQKIKSFPVILSGVEGAVTWNGTDENNQLVPSGIYFYKLKTDNFEKTRKMLLMK